MYKRGWFLIQRIANSILCDNYLVASRLCMGKAHLKIRYHKRGLGWEKDCVMNMRDLCHEYGPLRHEYKRGCILRVTFLATSLGG